MRQRPRGKEAVFQRYWSLVFSQQHAIEKNNPSSMANLKLYDHKLSTLRVVIKEMDWWNECYKWAEENGKLERVRAKEDVFRERFGTKDDPKEPLRYKEWDEFKRITLGHYHEAIMNQGISHEDFMQRFKNEFSDVFDNWEEG